MAEKKATTSDAGPAKPSIVTRVLGIAKYIFMGLNVAVMAGGLAWIHTTTLGYHDPKILEEEEGPKYLKERDEKKFQPIVYTMDKFTVNLDGEPQRVIQTEVNLEMLDEEGFENVVALGPQARDTVVKLLNGKTYADIETIQGKLFLKDQIITELNSIIKKGVVKQVYFSHFVVQ